MKNKLILTRGLPASGKSYWAKKKVAESNGACVRVNRDDLRMMLNPDGKGSYQFSKKNEQFVSAVQEFAVMSALKQGKNVIMDDTNFGNKVFLKYTNLIKESGIDATIEINDDFLKTPLEECVRRDIIRANGVGKDVIMRFYNTLIKEDGQ